MLGSVPMYQPQLPEGFAGQTGTVGSHGDKAACSPRPGSPQAPRLRIRARQAGQGLSQEPQPQGSKWGQNLSTAQEVYFIPRYFYFLEVFLYLTYKLKVLFKNFLKSILQSFRITVSGDSCRLRGNCPFPDIFCLSCLPSDVKTNPPIWDKHHTMAVFHKSLAYQIPLVFIFLSKAPS